MRIGSEVLFTPASDMYAFGVMMGDIFRDIELEESKGDQGRSSLEVLKHSLTQRDPQRRPSAQKCLEDPFLSSTSRSTLVKDNPVDSISPPLYWNIDRYDESSFQLNEIECRGHTWNMIEDFMRSRWREDLIGVGRDGGGMTHRSFECRYMWRIENGNLWSRYASRRSMIQGSPDPPFSSSVNTSDFERSLSLDVTKSEVVLFHGASCGTGDSKNVIDMIIRQGFDERLADIRGMFGSAIYFANMSSKSDCYIPMYTVSSCGEVCRMIIARVVMGNTYLTIKPMRKTRRPPCLESCGEPCSHDRFDSIWFDNSRGAKKNYQEYMVYDRYQCYPEFVIEYKRV